MRLTYNSCSYIHITYMCTSQGSQENAAELALLPAEERGRGLPAAAEEGGESPALHVRPAGPPHLLSLRGQSSLLASQVCTLPTALCIH